MEDIAFASTLTPYSPGMRRTRRLPDRWPQELAMLLEGDPIHGSGRIDLETGEQDVLSRWPDRMDRWHRFAEARQRGRARAWLSRPIVQPTRPTVVDGWWFWMHGGMKVYRGSATP